VAFGGAKGRLVVPAGWPTYLYAAAFRYVPPCCSDAANVFGGVWFPSPFFLGTAMPPLSVTLGCLDTGGSAHKSCGWRHRCRCFAPYARGL